MKKQGFILAAVLVSLSLFSRVTANTLVIENYAPVFTSKANTSALEDSVYTYYITTSDNNGDALMVYAKQLPSWLSLSYNYDGTAILTGTPDNSKLGKHSYNFV